MSSFKKLSDVINVEKYKPNEDQKVLNLPPSIELVEAKRKSDARAALWKNACSICGIRGLYQNASLDQANMLHPNLIQMGRDWAKSPKRGSLYLHGNTGSGKSYFATALYRQLVEDGHPWIIFVTAYDLDEELFPTKENPNPTYYLEKYCEVPILFIDDVGVERDTDRVARNYYSIVDARASCNLTTVMTSNLAREALPFGDRVISRLNSFFSIEFPRVDLRRQFNLPMF